MTRRRMPALIVAAALVLGNACGGGDDDTAGGSPSTATSSSTTVAPTTAPSTSSTTTAPPPLTTTPPTTSPPTTTPPGPPLLRDGDRGPAVEEVQRQLEELRYWVGPTDGSYGTLTEQAVYAFQKVNGLAIDGVVGPDTRAALANPAPPSPQSTAGLVWEVDKFRQVLMAVQDGEVLWIWNTSTGTEQPYTFEGRQLLADTPPGQYTIDWQVDGWRDGALGRMWRPKYFHSDGIAIHGYGSVPPFPASHGCVRVTIAAMDYIWSENLAPIGTPVWVYGQSPV